MPLHPNVRRCTHVQITGHRCGSPALKQEYFCYFHTRMIKGVQTGVDSQIHPVALIENAEAIQAAIMHTIDAVLKGTIDNKRANIVLKALYIAVRNSRNVYFHLREDEMVRQVPNYAQQYLTEHPELNSPEPNPAERNPHVAPDAPVGGAERSSAGSSQELSSENQARENASPETESLNPPPTSTAPTQPQPEAPKKNNHQQESHPERAHKRESNDPHAASSANPATGNSSNGQERGRHKARGQEESHRQENRQRRDHKKENHEPEDHQEESHPERTCHIARVEHSHATNIDLP